VRKGDGRKLLERDERMGKPSEGKTLGGRNAGAILGPLRWLFERGDNKWEFGNLEM
jgi:hypothetical protein